MAQGTECFWPIIYVRGYAMTRGEMDEHGVATRLQTIANSRATLGMFGSGYIEMLGRQITEDLQAIRNTTPPGGTRALVSKGISFGTIARASDAPGSRLAFKGSRPRAWQRMDQARPPASSSVRFIRPATSSRSDSSRTTRSTITTASNRPSDSA